MEIDWGIVARTIHILSVVVWIGGVWLVTTVLLPAIRRKPPDLWLAEFDAIEERFAPQARIAVLLVLLSGVYMLYAYDMWSRFADIRYWWMDLMIGVWLVFAALLFVIEPLVSRRIANRRVALRPELAMSRMLMMHRVLLGLSLLAIFGAVGGSRGLF